MEILLHFRGTGALGAPNRGRNVPPANQTRSGFRIDCNLLKLSAKRTSDVRPAVKVFKVFDLTSFKHTLPCLSEDESSWPTMRTSNDRHIFPLLCQEGPTRTIMADPRMFDGLHIWLSASNPQPSNKSQAQSHKWTWLD
jgi:hypothetical protein